MSYKQFMQMVLTIIVVVAIALTFGSCKKKESPTGPGDNGTGGGNSSLFGNFPVPNIPNVGGILGVVDAVTSVAGFPIEVKYALAAFYATGTNLDYAGDVKVNSSSLDTLNSANGPIYMRPSSKNPTAVVNVNFSDTSHANFTVAGAGSVPAFSASITTPKPSTITAPSANATVSRSSNLTITWNNTGADSVMVFVMDLHGHSVVKLGLANNGSYTVQAADLSGFNAEQGTVMVVKYRWAVQAAGGKNYALVAETMNTVMVTFN